MSRWLRFLRTVMALGAIIAYALPAASHAAPGGHPGPVPHETATAPCPGHGVPHQHADRHAHDTAAGAAQAPDPDAPVKCPGHKDGATSCCVAMCHAALPLPVATAPWLAPVKVANDNRLVASLGPTLITRLDRPPKPRVPLNG